MDEKPRVWHGLTVCCVVCLSLATSTQCYAGPIAGEIVKILDSTDFSSAEFALHPTKPFLYATSYKNDSVAIVNTHSLSVVGEVKVGHTPTGLAVSPNGDRVFVAHRLGVSVIDTHTKLVSLFPLTFSPYNVAYGYDDRLWLSDRSARKLLQIDAYTGQSTGPSEYTGYNGMLEISKDRHTLYYASSASPTTLKEFDISGPAPSLAWTNKHGMLGDVGEDLVVSHDGSFLALIGGGGNDLMYPYDVGLLSTTDHSVLGVLNVGPYPQEIAFSPNNKFAYVVHKAREIDVFSIDTFQKIETWLFGAPYAGAATEIVTDRTGRYLFAAKSGHLLVFATGNQIIPEPPTFVQPVIILAVLLSFRWRASGI